MAGGGQACCVHRLPFPRRTEGGLERIGARDKKTPPRMGMNPCRGALRKVRGDCVNGASAARCQQHNAHYLRKIMSRSWTKPSEIFQQRVEPAWQDHLNNPRSEYHA